MTEAVRVMGAGAAPEEGLEGSAEMRGWRVAEGAEEKEVKD